MFYLFPESYHFYPKSRNIIKTVAPTTPSSYHERYGTHTGRDSVSCTTHSNQLTLHTHGSWGERRGKGRRGGERVNGESHRLHPLTPTCSPPPYNVPLFSLFPFNSPSTVWSSTLSSLSSFCPSSNSSCFLFNLLNYSSPGRAVFC